MKIAILLILFCASCRTPKVHMKGSVDVETPKGKKHAKFDIKVYESLQAR